MLQIGEFAGLTGLSVKALRHYDEKAVLVPAEVALFDAIAGREIDLRDMEVRQTVLGQSEEDYAVEVSVAVKTR